MPIAPDLLTATTAKPADKAWPSIIDHLWRVFSADLPATAVDAEIVKRDRGLTELDNIISGFVKGSGKSGVLSGTATAGCLPPLATSASGR